MIVVPYSDALRLHSNSPDILAIRGLVLFLSGKLPQALQHVASALRLDPGHEKARKLRIRVKDVERLKEEGNVAFKTGKLDEAIAKYTEALDVSVRSLIHVLFYSAFHDSKSDKQRRKAVEARSAPHCYRIVRPRY